MGHTGFNLYSPTMLGDTARAVTQPRWPFRRLRHSRDRPALRVALTPGGGVSDWSHASTDHRVRAVINWMWFDYTIT
jgi:hypothetical protein